ncbi:MAG TPA: hypothetical protein EYG38_11770, partial [Verrucomicrobia bacterium]|nr:hypothetical protein [Verrucomicrobiota bacterium]
MTAQLINPSFETLRTCWLGLVTIFTTASTVYAAFDDPGADLDKLPEAPSGFVIEMFAAEPLVRNPCSLAFDALGRMFVGMGPQYRKPRP